MPTLEWACRRKTGTPRGHESTDNPSLRKNMATPGPTQDIDSILRVAMPPDTLPQRMATPLLDPPFNTGGPAPPFTVMIPTGLLWA